MGRAALVSDDFDLRDTCARELFIRSSELAGVVNSNRRESAVVPGHALRLRLHLSRVVFDRTVHLLDISEEESTSVLT